jgi:hypothetical protein
VVRPYRHWNKRPYYGTIIGGVAIGTILGAAAYSAVAPAPNLCWYADPRLLGLLPIGLRLAHVGACSSTDRAPDFESGG